MYTFKGWFNHFSKSYWFFLCWSIEIARAISILLLKERSLFIWIHENVDVLTKQSKECISYGYSDTSKNLCRFNIIVNLFFPQLSDIGECQMMLHIIQGSRHLPWCRSAILNRKLLSSRGKRKKEQEEAHLIFNHVSSEEKNIYHVSSQCLGKKFIQILPLSVT